jgi:hypothetical protein
MVKDRWCYLTARRISCQVKMGGPKFVLRVALSASRHIGFIDAAYMYSPFSATIRTIVTAYELLPYSHCVTHATDVNRFATPLIVHSTFWIC